jgi:hypothetical protein
MVHHVFVVPFPLAIPPRELAALASVPPEATLLLVRFQLFAASLSLQPRYLYLQSCRDASMVKLPYDFREKFPPARGRIVGNSLLLRRNDRLIWK